MAQIPRRSVAAANPRPTFFRLTVGLIVLLMLVGAAVGVLVIREYKNIEIVTGITMTAISAPMYRRISVRGLYWYPPLSVYVAISIYGLVIFVVRHLIDDFDSSQTRWAVGLQSILGMWWGTTVLVPLALAVQALAYVNHRVLRRILTTTI